MHKIYNIVGMSLGISRCSLVASAKGRFQQGLIEVPASLTVTRVY